MTVSGWSGEGVQCFFAVAESSFVFDFFMTANRRGGAFSENPRHFYFNPTNPKKGFTK